MQIHLLNQYLLFEIHKLYTQKIVDLLYLVQFVPNQLFDQGIIILSKQIICNYICCGTFWEYTIFYYHIKIPKINKFLEKDTHNFSVSIFLYDK